MSAPIITIYETSTAGTTHTFNTDTQWFRVYVHGGGREGATYSSPWTGRSGGASSCAISVIDITLPTANIVVGVAGVGTTGGTSSFTYDGATITSNGGLYATETSFCYASGGDINITRGLFPAHSWQSTTSNYPREQSSSTFWGCEGFGSGGEGWTTGVNVSSGGGQAFDGAIIIEEYL